MGTSMVRIGRKGRIGFDSSRTIKPVSSATLVARPMLSRAARTGTAFREPTSLRAPNPIHVPVPIMNTLTPAMRYGTSHQRPGCGTKYAS